ncbi:MAG: fructose-6-phosphate aldolase, partial [Bdellovibrionaceae bacterium]|nr:fructose-6-phosphate aldolase [Pseudobdellovibrionaceae bacterium]
MKIFLDTADIDEIKRAKQLSLIDGVTTNPSLVAKTKKKHENLIKDICELLKDKPVSAEVLAVKEE